MKFSVRRGIEGFIISITWLLFHFQEQELSGCSWCWEFVSTFVFRKSIFHHWGNLTFNVYYKKQHKFNLSHKS
jgi:hypothetical protein